MDSEDEQIILRERSRRWRLREENGMDDDERRERRRRVVEERDRLMATWEEDMRRAHQHFEEVNAREREEEEEEKKRNPASRKAMVDLRIPAVGETREQDCAVCLEEFVDGGRKLRMMPCSHSFHQRCIFDWLDRDHRCPVCRFALTTKREEDEQRRMLACQQQEQAAAEVS